ncbi:MAG: type II toxin-antitoxin system VapC family toxin [Alphaproteobacteria bacterium]|nr:type II toxin-antitoxin system VapC family toxin [Alphaproteobacteria bacterium]
MKLLLGTLALAWWFADSPRLAGGARARIAHPTTQVLVSAASAWEIAIKHEAGRWPEAARMLDRWDALLAEAGFAALPVSAAHGMPAARWDWAHRDPFDRLLAAQSMLEGAALLTADPVLLGLLPDAMNAAA